MPDDDIEITVRVHGRPYPSQESAARYLKLLEWARNDTADHRAEMTPARSEGASRRLALAMYRFEQQQGELIVGLVEEAERPVVLDDDVVEQEGASE